MISSEGLVKLVSSYQCDNCDRDPVYLLDCGCNLCSGCFKATLKFSTGKKYSSDSCLHCKNFTLRGYCKVEEGVAEEGKKMDFFVKRAKGYMEKVIADREDEREEVRKENEIYCDVIKLLFRDRKVGMDSLVDLKISQHLPYLPEGIKSRLFMLLELPSVQNSTKKRRGFSLRRSFKSDKTHHSLSINTSDFIKESDPLVNSFNTSLRSKKEEEKQQDQSSLCQTDSSHNPNFTSFNYISNSNEIHFSPAPSNKSSPVIK